MKCPFCKTTPFSMVDKKYLELHDTCWECDNERFKKGTLPLAQFEWREELAQREASK